MNSTSEKELSSSEFTVDLHAEVIRGIRDVARYFYLKKFDKY